MLARTTALVLVSALGATALSLQEIADGFEEAAPGALPGSPWKDVVERVAGASVPTPTARVIETEDAHGRPTRAIRIHDAIGTSQGLYADIPAGRGGTLSVDVRIEQFCDAQGPKRWPIAVGFTCDATDADLNSDPHVVVYPYHDRRWYLFVRPRDTSQVRIVPIEAPPLELDRWYTVLIEGDFETGAFRAEIADAREGEPLGSVRFEAPDWDTDANRFDAIAFYDGEYGTTGGTKGGSASFDNVSYAPVEAKAAEPSAEKEK